MIELNFEFGINKIGFTGGDFARIRWLIGNADWVYDGSGVSMGVLG